MDEVSGGARKERLGYHTAGAARHGLCSRDVATAPPSAADGAAFFPSPPCSLPSATGTPEGSYITVTPRLHYGYTDTPEAATLRLHGYTTVTQALQKATMGGVVSVPAIFATYKTIAPAMADLGSKVAGM